MSEQNMEIVQNLENYLEILSTAMSNPPVSEEQKKDMQEMLQQCELCKKEIWTICETVIEQPNGDTLFNKIVGDLDHLERLESKFPSWSATAVGTQPPGSPSLADMTSLSSAPGALGGQEFGSIQASSSDTGRSRKGKKKDKKMAIDEVAFPAAQNTFAPANNRTFETLANDPFGSASSPEVFAPWPDVPAASDAPVAGASSWATDGDAAWTSTALDTATFGSSGNKKGLEHAAGSPSLDMRPLDAGGFGFHNEDANTWAADGGLARQNDRGGAHVISLHIQCPFNEIASSMESFKAQFVQAAAHATGVAPARIRVRDIRPR